MFARPGGWSAIVLGIASANACQLVGGIKNIDLAAADGGASSRVDSGSRDDGGTRVGRDGGQLGHGSGSGTSADTGIDTGGCPGGVATSISGKVYDPAGKNPLYGVSVYVPAAPLAEIPKGVPQGAAACACGALFASGSLASTTTMADGTFVLKGVPSGARVPLVLQVGKWRRSLAVAVTTCEDNAQPDGSLTLPGTVTAEDTDDNMPDIAVSTGGADSLECLLLRMGVSASEYVAGNGTTGHVHVFTGGQGGGSGGLGARGMSEAVPMPGAPPSQASLWNNASQLMRYDLVLLSCEGGETSQANPQAMESYLNAGGRALASHFHYAWFAGPLLSGQAYSAPAEWRNLATWTPNTSTASTGATGGSVQATLNGSTAPFPRGVALAAWLADRSALGGGGAVPPTQLPIYEARNNAIVSASNTASQPWINSTPSALYFSFNTPVGQTDGAAPMSCGRAAFSDLHASGNPMTADNATLPPPTSCDPVALSPQEDALEFMVLDLLSCVLPDSVDPATVRVP